MYRAWSFDALVSLISNLIAPGLIAAALVSLFIAERPRPHSRDGRSHSPMRG